MRTTDRNRHQRPIAQREFTRAKRAAPLRSKVISARFLVLAGPVIGTLAAWYPHGARALDFTIGNATVSLQTTISAGVGIRTADPNPYFLDAAHGGTYTGAIGPSDLNWPKGKAFQAPLRATHDLQIDLDNYTAFFRAAYLFDPINSDPNSGVYQPLPHQALTTVGHNFRLLDGFVRGNYALFDQSQTATIGWQTFNWGESTFFRNGLNAVNPIDTAGIHAAGADIRSLYLPIPAIDLRSTLPGGFSIEAFYEFAWVKTQLDPYGTFFSLDTPVSPGATSLELAPRLQALGLGRAIPRTSDRKASDGGQFGVALRRTFETMDGAQLGLYFENYGSRFPIFSLVTGQKNRPAGESYAQSSAFRGEYPNHIQYYGASLSGTGPFGSAVQGEFSYTPNQPLQLNALGLLGAVISPSLTPTLTTFCNLGIALACEKRDQLAATDYIAAYGQPGYHQELAGYQRFQVSHLRVSGVKSFGAIAGTPIQTWNLVMEYGLDIVHDFPSEAKTPLFRPASVNALNATDAAFFTNGVVNKEGAPTQFSQGIVGRASFNMPTLIASVVDVTPSLAVEWDFQGTTPLPLSTFDEHVLTTTVGIGFSYLQRWQASVNYTSRFGLGGTARYSSQLDRDYVVLAASYRF